MTTSARMVATRDTRSARVDPTLPSLPSPPSHPSHLSQLIVFGHELAMLLLHMRSLHAAVDGFLVTESTTCFQTRRSKPAHLSEAMRARTVPEDLRAITHVKVVHLWEAVSVHHHRHRHRAGGHAAGHAAEHAAEPSSRGNYSFCSKVLFHKSNYSTRCFQQFQRWSLLRLLAAVAHRDDLALVSDVDEIAHPSFVSLAAACAPFPPGFADESLPGQIVLKAHQHKFGAHCESGAPWLSGPRLYSVSWVLDTFYPSEESDDWHVPLVDFDEQRNRVYLPTTRYAVGWHLTSFGSIEQLLLKLATFGASHVFNAAAHADALDPLRIDACRSGCIELTYDVTRYVGGKRVKRRNVPSPCANTSWVPPAAAHLTSHGGSRRLLRPPHTSTALGAHFLMRGHSARSWLGHALPPYLLDHPEEFPPSWWANLRAPSPAHLVQCNTVKC